MFGRSGEPSRTGSAARLAAPTVVRASRRNRPREGSIMSNPRASLILHHFRRAVSPAGAEASDRELLRRFAAGRDEEAFARLLRRHRPLVQGVSLRVLGNWHDSEDVVQATFLVLARKAGTLRWQESAASWLYRVAYHLSLKVRAAAGRRQRRE